MRSTATRSIALPAQRLAPFLVSVVVFILAYASPVSYAWLDAHPTLLVSQSIIDNHTSHLDAYLSSPTIKIEHWVAQAPNGHYYYFWPTGTSALSVPYVWLLNRAGQDMAVVDSNHRAQNLLSAAICATVFLVLYQMGRCYLDPWPSLAIATVSVLGSALISSVGTALWNIDFPILFIALSLLLICRFETGNNRRVDPYALGVFLFGAFFCRPTAATFVIVILIYLLIRNRSWFLKAALPAGGLLGLFVLWSWVELGTLVPAYYSSGAFGAKPFSAWVAAGGHLFSPSRGILIFSPFFAPALIAAALHFRQLRKQAIFWMISFWLVIQFVVVSNAAMWWGGHSFGPRLNAELLPALILVTILAWHAFSSRSAVGTQRMVAAAYLFLGLVAIWINVGQGLYNQNAMIWNGGLMAPEIDAHPDYLLDWQYPQFLATNRSLCSRNLEHLSAFDPANLGAYRIGDEIQYSAGMDEIDPAVRRTASTAISTNAYSNVDSPPQTITRSTVLVAPAGLASRADHVLFLPTITHRWHSGPKALFLGWSTAEDGFRWTNCQSARIVFKLESVDTHRLLELTLLAGSFGPQRVTVLVNASPIGTLSMDTGPAFHTLQFSSVHLIQPGVNVVEFQMPDAANPDNPLDSRLLGIQLVTFGIQPVSEEPSHLQSHLLTVPQNGE